MQFEPVKLQKGVVINQLGHLLKPFEKLIDLPNKHRIKGGRM
jgi:hypothetical protein